MHDQNARHKADAFLKAAAEFQLGNLPTEAQNPETASLSQLACNDLPAAIESFKSVELKALQNALLGKLDVVEKMADAIRKTFANNGRVFLVGCGATGRLSVALETLWREEVNSRALAPSIADQVISFIAGGDYALVRSIESFEDHTEYGTQQLLDLGFSSRDLLIAITEGGETPFVIGAVEEAVRVSTQSPYFLFCNPTSLLIKTTDRSRRVLTNPRIVSHSFETGPMALAGSTRLQASTVLMLAAGAALLSTLPGTTVKTASDFIHEFEKALKKTDFTSLAPLIQREAEIYANNEICVHRTSTYGVTVLTDTTERSPTFSLIPFENDFDSTPNLSWTYLVIDQTQSASDAWERILHRAPRPLDWPRIKEKFGERILQGFDFSPRAITRRKRKLQPDTSSDTSSGTPSGTLHVCDIFSDENTIRIQLGEFEASLKRPTSLLVEHLILKCALNISSTLLMARLGRIRGNLMVYVRPTNNKLIDRSIRCTRSLLNEAGIHQFSYEDICYALFEILETLQPGQAAVPETFHYLQSVAHGAKVR